MENLTTEKLEKLKESLQNMQKTAVAFSGGVDSTFLLKVARDVLSDNAVAVTVRSCLVPRFVYGEKIDEASLKMVEAAEQFLLDSGFTQMRVRVHGKMARIEVPPQDFPLMLENTAKINGALKGLGFSYVTMDLQGYRTGSMNEAFYKGNF